MPEEKTMKGKLNKYEEIIERKRNGDGSDKACEN
jgi:hypothetical protein